MIFDARKVEIQAIGFIKGRKIKEYSLRCKCCLSESLAGKLLIGKLYEVKNEE